MLGSLESKEITFKEELIKFIEIIGNLKNLTIAHSMIVWKMKSCQLFFLQTCQIGNVKDIKKG